MYIWGSHRYGFQRRRIKYISHPQLRSETSKEKGGDSQEYEKGKWETKYLMGYTETMGH